MKKRAWTFKIITTCLVLAALVSFNWDRQEIENRAFVMAMGIDIIEDDDNPFLVSFSIVDVLKLDENEGKNIMHTTQAPTLEVALSETSAKTSQKMYFAHTKAIVLGEGVLSNGDVAEGVIDTLRSRADVSLTTILMASEGKAKDIIEAKTQKDGCLGLYLADFYNKDNVNTAAHVMRVDLKSFKADCLLPLVTLAADEKDDKDNDKDEVQELEVCGVAALKGFELVRYIPQDDLGGLVWVKANASGEHVAVEGTTLKIERSKSKIDFIENESRLYCYINVDAAGNILERGSFKEAKLFEEKIKKEIEGLLAFLQKEGAIDAFGFLGDLKKKEPNLYRQYRDDFMKDVVFVVGVDL
ncbi:MAG: hypothetical protein FWC69_01125, partial [Defluviitaleaceae bacterium]|nr:hypothetical protein [Defluviitaleaceae bacterium]